MRWPHRLAGAGLVLGALAAAQASFPDWVRYAEQSLETAFFREVELPGGAAPSRRPPRETRELLGDRIQAQPDAAELYALRAHEAERGLDMEAAERDWREFATRAEDPAVGQLALADFYGRRLEADNEIEALLAVGRSPSPASERFTPAALGRSWQAFERILKTADEHALDDTVRRDAYTAWLGRFPEQPSVYQRYLSFLVERAEFEAAEQLIGDYADAFAGDAVFPVQARARIAAGRDGADAALALLERDFEPLWPAALLATYFEQLENADRLRARLDEARAAVAANPDDLRSRAWLFHYYRRQGDPAAAIAELQQHLGGKEQRAAAWTGSELAAVGELFAQAGAAVDAARCRYALYSLPGATAAEREAALAGLIGALLDSPEEPLAFAAGDFSFYKDIATMDDGPGWLNGLLSLALNSQNLDWQWRSEEMAAAPYLKRARAIELLGRFETEFPQSDRRAGLRAKAVETLALYGDDEAVIREGGRFLSDFSVHASRTAVQILIAEAYARQERTDEEFAAYRSLLAELGRLAEGVPLGPGTLAEQLGAVRYGAQAAIGARSPEYARVLDRYVARLAAMNRLEDAIRVHVEEIARNPDDPGLYERLAGFLEVNGLSERVEGIYRQAMDRFQETSWRHKLGRWYLRRQRAAELERLSREVVDAFSGGDLEDYFQGVVGGAAGFDARLYIRLNQYALERFPHNLTFVRNLINAYRRRDTRDAAAEELLLRRHWFYADDLRSQFFALLTRTGRLEAELETLERALDPAGSTWNAAARENAAGVLTVAEGKAWLCDYEGAGPAALALTADAPTDEPIATRAAALHRSLAAYDAVHTDIAVSLTEASWNLRPGEIERLALAGDTLADRGRFDDAAERWLRMPEAKAGDPQGYLAAATVFWDYFFFDEALERLNEGRRRLSQPALFAYEAGAIREGLNDAGGAVGEYLQGALATQTDYQSRSRLVRLARSERYREAIDQATSRLTAGRAPSAQAVNLRVSVLEALEQRDELEAFLIDLAGRTDARSLVDEVERVGRSRGLAAVRVAALERRIELTRDPVESLRLRLELVRLHESLEDFDEAERVSAAVHRDSSRVLGVVRSRTDFLWRRERRDEAIATLLEAARAAYPELAAEFRFEAANKAVESERYEQARGLLTELLETTPFEPRYTTAMADAFAREGRDADLRAFYEEQLQAARDAELGPAREREIVARLRRGLIPALERLGDHAAAVDQYIELINRFPEDAALTMEAVYYAEDHAVPERLVDAYVRTTAESPRDVRYHRVLARIYGHLGRRPQAIEAYGRAIDVRPDSVEMWRERTQLEERLLRFDEARAGYEKLYELTYEDPQWMERIARIHALRGAIDEARAALEKALIDNRPERPGNYFAVAERLQEWGLGDDALGYAIRGVGLAGERLVSDENSGAGLYLELMAEQRRFVEGVERLRQSRPREPNDFWIYRFESVLARGLDRARRLYTPEEREELAAALESLRRSARPEEIEQALLPAVRAAGLASIEARWLGERLLAAPAGGNWAGDRQRLIELQTARMQHAELARRLEQHWQAHPTRNQETHLLNEAAEAYRVAGLADDEFRVLGLSGGGRWEERYYELLLERDSARLVELARVRTRAVEYALLRGDADLASRAVEAYGTRRNVVWNRAYQALTGLFLNSPEERYDAAFQQALGGGTIGERIGQAIDRDQRLAGDVWFYYGGRYGEYRAATERDGADDYLSAELELAPTRASGYFALGERLEGFGETDQAAANYLLALELNDGDPRAHARLASIAAAAGRRTEAVEHWKQALGGYAARVTRGSFGPEFWKDAADLFAAIQAAGAAGELRGDERELLRAYVKRNGYYRASELLEAAFEHGMPLDDLLALEAEAPDAAGFLGVFADAAWLPRPERARAFERVIAATRTQLEELPAEQSYYPRQQLEDWRVRQIEFLLDGGEIAAAQAAVAAGDDDFEASLAFRNAALWLRLAALGGRIETVFDDDAPMQPQMDQVAAAASKLREGGSAAEADRLLEAFYTARIAQRDLTPAYLLGLADLRLRQGSGEAAEAVLRRLTATAAEPFTQHLAAAELLAAYGRNQEAAALAAERVQAAPWDRGARLLQARLAADGEGLAALARDSSADYAVRVEAARGLGTAALGSAALGSAELDLLASGEITAAAARGEYFLQARLAAADGADVETRAALLAEALALEPEREDGAVRLRLFETARSTGRHEQAIAALVPLVGDTALGYAMRQPDSIFDERPERPSAERWVVEEFIGQAGVEAARRAMIAPAADSLEALGRLQAAALAYEISYRLAATAELEAARERVTAVREALAENARRRPRITNNLEQPGAVRPRAALEAGR